MNSTERITVIGVSAILLMLLIGVGGSLIQVRQAAAPPPLVEAEIIEVLDEPYYTEAKTLVELEDGRRLLLHTYYGQPGDTFMHRPSPR